MSSPAQYTYLDNASLQQIERERTLNIDAATVISEIMPITEENTDNVLWELRDNVDGLMFHRGPDEPFPNRKDTGVKRYSIIPGRFGEIVRMSEEKVERSRKVGTFGDAVDVSAEASRIMEEIAYREKKLMDYIRWELIVNGVVNVADNAGVTTEVGRYTPKTYTPNVPWSTVATATPVNDFRIVRDTFAGLGFDFGGGGLAIANSKTWNMLWRNTNTADLYGKRGVAQGSINGLADFQKAILGPESLAGAVAMDDTYTTEAGVVTRFIPDGKVIFIGKHSAYGYKMGKYVLTRNASNPNGGPGIYAGMGTSVEPPLTPWVARGHNGGPAINFGNQVIVATMFTP